MFQGTDGSSAFQRRQSLARRDTLTTLSELTQLEDVEPVVDTSISDFVDEFFVDEDDPFWGVLQDAEVEYDDLKDIGGSDFIDIMAAFMRDEVDRTDESEEDVVYNRYNILDIYKGKRFVKQKVDYPHLTGSKMIFSVLGSADVLVGNGIDNLTVGKTDGNIVFKLSIENLDYFKLANTYAEEVGGKGVNLGFSSFFHSVAILMFARNSNGVIEPHDGSDYAFDCISVEITGENWQRRESAADIIINKYMMVSAMSTDQPCQKEYTDWSWAEDHGLLDAFRNTAFDTEETERSPIITRIADLLPYITDAQRTRLGKNYRGFCSEQPVVPRDRSSKNRDYTKTIIMLDNCIKAGAKEVDGSWYVPSPFRVLYPLEEPEMLDPDEELRRQDLRIFTTDYGYSTYHTWEINRDPTALTQSTSDNYPEKHNYTRNSFHDALHQHYKKYKAFTSASIQASLLPKIFGKAGCFYDRYNRVGISWHRKSASSLTWFCVYYTFSKPGLEEEIGKWSYNNIRGVFISPTFKISRQDIHFASALPTKIAGVLSACRPLLSPKEYAKSEGIICGMICIQNNSTWMTSHRCGANRFLTCCHMSECGDLPKLIEGQLKNDNYHRFCDFFLLKLMKNFISDNPSSNVTPLFRLPFPIMSYEKDFSQTLQWHMRDGKHSTACMIKVSDAARRHKKEEHATRDWLEMQYDFLHKMMNEGVSASEYRKLMYSAPDFPCMNIVMFIGMCNIVKDDIKSIGSVQHSLGFSLWSMITDRHCTTFKGYTGDGTPQLQTAKVVDAMSSYIRSFGNISGAYELVARMSQGDKLPPNYLLNHYKDSKESERNISQLFPQHRVKQNMPEALTETFTGNNDADQMSDTLKYNKHVEDTMQTDKRGHGYNASEDRSAFCQEQDPQQQGLGIACISYEAGSTCLRTAAALTMMNKTRVIVYPPDADHATLLEGLEYGNAITSTTSKKQVTCTLKIEKNMTEGLGATTAGAINTIFVTANDKVVVSLVDGLESVAARTTSDDVKRSACYTGDKNRESVGVNYYYGPNRFLNQCMMKDNTKKPIYSNNMSEFNNVVATKTGMVPQSPIFATLCIQPLLSKSLFGDIVEVVVRSRSTMSWGCPPDTMEASMHGMIRMLRQKWLLSDHETDTLWNAGFFPTCLREHISGFWIRNENTLRIVYSQFTEEQRKDVLHGNVALFDMLKRAELDTGMRKKKKRQKHKPIPGLNRANRVADTIYAARYVAERCMSRHIQPIPPGQRSTTKKRFFQMIEREIPDVDILELQRLAPPNVTVHIRAARKQDRLPTSLGTSAKMQTASITRIRASRFAKVNFRDHLTDEERRISALEEDDYRKEIAAMERHKHYEGFSFKSPVGLPLTRIFDNNIYTRPASFSFSVDFESHAQVEQPFTFGGNPVTNFRPILYGSASIARITKTPKTRLAFGHGYFKNEHVIFYKGADRSSDVRCIRVPAENQRVQSVNHIGFDVYYRTTIDATPLKTYDHASDARPMIPGLMGDNDAILNYGFFCRSSQPSGFAIYRSLFASYKSFIPNSVMNHMPQYPFFPFRERTIEIDRGRATQIVDNKCIAKLRLVSCDRPENVVKIVLSGDIPMVSVDEEYEDDIVW